MCSLIYRVTSNSSATRKMLLTWIILNKDNYEMSTVIKRYDIADPSLLHDIIREKADLMYRR